MNLPLVSFVFTIASGVIIGILMTMALVTGFNEISHIIGVCIVGFFLAIPMAIIVAKRLENFGGVKPKPSV